MCTNYGRDHFVSFVFSLPKMIMYCKGTKYKVQSCNSLPHLMIGELYLS